MVHGTWYVVYGTWCMVHGIWYMVHGIWYMVDVARSVVGWVGVAVTCSGANIRLSGFRGL